MKQQPKPAAPDEAFNALHRFIITSNEFLKFLHGLAALEPMPQRKRNAKTRRHWDVMNPDLRGTIFAESGALPFVKHWHESLAAAYAEQVMDDARTALADIGGMLWRPPNDYTEAHYQPHLFREVRAPNGVFLRKFESKLLAVERCLAALAVKATPGDAPPEFWLSADRHEPIVKAILGVLNKSPKFRFMFNHIWKSSGFSKNAVQICLAYLVAEKRIIHHGERKGYSINPAGLNQ